MKLRAVLVIAVLAAAAALVLERLAQRSDRERTSARAALAPGLEGAPMEVRQDDGVAPASRSEVAVTSERSQPNSCGPTTRVTGRVLASDAAPAPGVLVWLMSTDFGVPTIAVSDPQGVWELELPRGRCSLIARDEELRTAEATLQVGDERVAGVELVLRDGGVIRGQVLDAAGRPRADVRVEATQEDAPWADFAVDGRSALIGGAETLTDERGEFVLRGLPSVRHTITPAAERRKAQSFAPPMQAGVRPGDPALAFTLISGHVVRGAVRDARSLRPVGSFVAGQSSFYSADGSFELELAPDRRFAIGARGYEKLNVTPQPAAGWTQFELTPCASLGDLELRVRDEFGAPVERFTANGRSPSWSRWTEHAFSVAALLVRGLCPGAHNVTIEAEGFVTAESRVEVVADTVKALEVTLFRTRVVPLHIRDALGRTAVDMMVEVVRSDGSAPAWKWLQNLAPGTSVRAASARAPDGERRWLWLSWAAGRIAGLREGDYLLRWCGHDHTGGEQPFRARTDGEQPFRVRAGDSGGIEIRL